MQTYPGDMYHPLASWTVVLQSPTTPSDFDIWQSADIPSSGVSLPLANQAEWYRALLHHVSLTYGRMHTYPGQLYPTPWIDPSSTEPYYTMPVWHVQEYRHMQVTYTTSSINPGCTKPQCTLSVSHVEECRHTHIRCISPTNGTQCYRALLHHISFICGRVQLYPGHMYPPSLPHPPRHDSHIVEERNTTWHHVSICYTNMCEMQK